jgi:hypothetical protein
LGGLLGWASLVTWPLQFICGPVNAMITQFKRRCGPSFVTGGGRSQKMTSACTAKGDRQEK